MKGGYKKLEICLDSTFATGVTTILREQFVKEGQAPPKPQIEKEENYDKTFDQMGVVYPWAHRLKDITSAQDTALKAFIGKRVYLRYTSMKGNTTDTYSLSTFRYAATNTVEFGESMYGLIEGEASNVDEADVRAAVTT